MIKILIHKNARILRFCEVNQIRIFIKKIINTELMIETQIKSLCILLSNGLSFNNPITMTYNKPL